MTGRPIRWMTEIKENFNFGLGICGNGAMLYDFLNEKILEEWLFSVEAQLETVKRLRAVIPPVTFAVEVNQQFAREKKYVPTSHQMKTRYFDTLLIFLRQEQ